MSDSCKYYEGLIDQMLDGDLIPTEEEALRLHLGNCRDCRRLCRETSAVTILLRTGRAEAPAALLSGVMSRIAAGTADGNAPAEETPAEPDAPAPAEDTEAPAAPALDFAIPALEMEVPEHAEEPAADTPSDEPAPMKIENITVSDEPTIKVTELPSKKKKAPRKAEKSAAAEQKTESAAASEEPLPKRSRAARAEKPAEKSAHAGKDTPARTEAPPRTDKHAKTENQPRTERPQRQDPSAETGSKHAPAEEKTTRRTGRKPVRVWPRVLIAACAALVIGSVAYGAIRVVNGETVSDIVAEIPFAESLGLMKYAAPAAEEAAQAEADAGAGVYEFSVANDADMAAEEPQLTGRADRVAMAGGRATVPEGREADFEALLQDAKWGEDGEPQADWTVIANVEYNGVIYEFSTDANEQYLRWRDAAEGLPVHSPGTVAELLDIIG